MAKHIDPYLKEAQDAVGGVCALADKLKVLLKARGDKKGITRSAVCLWKRCPPKRVALVEEITGVSRHKLRPDIFGPAA
jgi:DNA-binding transcriptional regulator YdaS (Cro superfamily)